jgi:hypothetical protein
VDSPHGAPQDGTPFRFRAAAAVADEQD